MSTMSVSEAVASRRSIRAFLDRPVPLDLLRRVMDKARMTPSGCNFQPWQATVLAGEPLRALQKKMLAAESQDPAEYIVQPVGLGDPHMARFKANGALMYGALTIDREDFDARRDFVESNVRSFGAPAVLFCYFPRLMGPPQWSDVGMWLQTIMLLLREEGLDSCPQEFMAIHARLIKDHLGVSDDSHIFFCGMAIGYRDEAAAVNHFERGRATLDEQVKFAGF
jgi:nitroreductase